MEIKQRVSVVSHITFKWSTNKRSQSIIETTQAHGALTTTRLRLSASERCKRGVRDLHHMCTNGFVVFQRGLMLLTLATKGGYTAFAPQRIAYVPTHNTQSLHHLVQQFAAFLVHRLHPTLSRASRAHKFWSLS